MSESKVKDMIISGGGGEAKTYVRPGRNNGARGIEGSKR